MKLTFPWLSDDYVSDWARTVQPGAGKDRGFCVLPEVGDEVLVAFEQGDVRRPYVLGGLFNGVDTAARPARSTDVDGGTGAINRRSLVSRRGPPDRPARPGRQQGGHHARDRRRQAAADPGRHRHQGHRAQRRQVLIEGKSGVTVDAASGKLELKGGQISITATTGVTVDGGPVGEGERRAAKVGR